MTWRRKIIKRTQIWQNIRDIFGIEDKELESDRQRVQAMEYVEKQ